MAHGAHFVPDNQIKTLKLYLPLPISSSPSRSVEYLDNDEQLLAASQVEVGVPQVAEAAHAQALAVELVQRRARVRRRAVGRRGRHAPRRAAPRTLSAAGRAAARAARAAPRLIATRQESV